MKPLRSYARILTLFFCCNLVCANVIHASFYTCQTDAECGFGVCGVDSKCSCNENYLDNTTHPCTHLKPTSETLTPFMLELFLGLVFPAGTAYYGLWEMVGLRLGIEVLFGGLTGAYLQMREHSLKKIKQEEHKIKALFAGSVITGVSHGALWVAGSTFFGEMYKQDAVTRAITHKDQGEADLVVMGSKIAESARITLNTFENDSCAIVEGCVDGAGERRLLRFDSWIHNRGKGDFVMAFESVTPEWSSCHGHYHGPDTADYILLQELTDGNGTQVVPSRYGHKQGYCYLDSERVFGDNLRKFSCGVARLTRQYTQGITSGWADVYHGSLDCQWIDITDLAPGNYQLKVTINPKGTYFQDENLTNNVAIVEVTIPPINEAIERTDQGQCINGSVLVDYQ